MKPLLFFEDSSQKISFYFSQPLGEIKINALKDVPAGFLKIDEWRKKGFYVAGAIAYEAGYAFYPEIDFVKLPETPLMHFFVFEKKNEGRPQDLQKNTVTEKGLWGFHQDLTKKEYVERQQQVREMLLDGDIYQLNQTFQKKFSTSLNPWQLYLQLQQNQKTHYSAYFDFLEYQIVSLSPELFLKKNGDQLITEPMKGTLPISESPQKLIEDEKTRAENLMIVDLLRNDLGRLAIPGSVKVDELFSIKTLSTVHQMTSRLSSRVDRDLEILTIFKSLFPCGSITGAPKWSAMQKIAHLEVSPRGYYTGALGFIDPQNNFCFNVAIRTIVCREKQCSLGVGGGIVLDSKIEEEYREAQIKARFVRETNSHFYLFETLLFDGNDFRNLHLHLERLKTSASFYDFEYCQDQLLRELQTVCGQNQLRVKILLFSNGSIEIQTSPLEALSSELRVSLSQKRISSQSHWQGHKTSQRQLYDQEWSAAQERGIYDVLFLNEWGYLTEASRHNLFVKIQGQWKTPPLSSGILPGIARQIFIKENFVVEENLSPECLSTCESLVLTNSVRGPVAVVWSET